MADILKDLYEHRCYYCGRKTGLLQKEHLIPLARGGVNNVSNIVPACPPCNLLKGTLTDQEFLTLLADRADYRAKRRSADSPTGEMPLGSKRCSKCQRVLPTQLFGTHAGKADGLASRCKSCAAAASADWRATNREKMQASRRASGKQQREAVRTRNLAIPPNTIQKRCSSCGETKPAADFHLDIYSPDGLQRRCKACRS